MKVISPNLVSVDVRFDPDDPIDVEHFYTLIEKGYRIEKNDKKDMSMSIKNMFKNLGDDT